VKLGGSKYIIDKNGAYRRLSFNAAATFVVDDYHVNPVTKEQKAKVLNWYGKTCPFKMYYFRSTAIIGSESFFVLAENEGVARQRVSQWLDGPFKDRYELAREEWLAGGYEALVFGPDVVVAP
jgi:hypothetical protein